LYEMVTGEPPFRGKSHVETMHAILHDPEPSVSNQPPELGEIVAKALAKDPKDRYQHAGDFRLDLRRLQKAWEAKTLLSQRLTPANTPQKQLNWTVGVTAILLLTSAVGFWMGRSTGPAAAIENPLANGR